MGDPPVPRDAVLRATKTTPAAPLDPETVTLLRRLEKACCDPSAELAQHDQG
jgi:hypothetical protein